MAEYPQQVLELFSQIGNRLKVAREERGYTLQELSAHTRINLQFLQKIEDGDLEGLPGLAFVKGFIRNYIQVLELKDADLDDALRRLGASPSPEAPPEQIRASNPQVLETDEPGVSYLKMGLFLVLAVLVLWVGWVLFQGSDEPEPTAQREAPTGALPEAQPSAPPAEAVPGGQTGTQPPSAARQAPGGAPPPGASPTSPGSTLGPPPGGAGAGASRSGAPLEGRQKLELTVRGLEPTWVRLSIDRAPPIDVLMQPAETVSWEANQEIRLTIGKSHGVAVYLNGEEILLPQEANRLIPNLVLNKLTLLRLEN